METALPIKIDFFSQNKTKIGKIKLIAAGGFHSFALCELND
jgi:hypothetical protein